MLVVARHRLTQSRPTVHPVEVFPSETHASLALLLRATHRKPGQYAVPGQKPFHHGTELEGTFAEADVTGFLAVWFYEEGEGATTDGPPHWLWYINDGQVFQHLWTAAFIGEWRRPVGQVTLPPRFASAGRRLPRLDIDALEANRDI